MNFVHLSLLAGLAAVAIPLMLHLLGRREPLVIDFPALRFVRQTQLEDSTSWRLRHFLLLLLRLLLILVLVMALARPRVHSSMMGSIIGISGLILLACLASLIAAVARASHRPATVWGTILLVALGLWLSVALWSYRAWSSGPALPSADSNAPVAVALIIDTSPSMAYQANNQSRLAAAKEMASWLLNRLPADSHVGMVSGLPMHALSLDPHSADGQLSSLQETTELVDLPGKLRTALELVLADELERKELYLLTDMNSAAWKSSQVELAEFVQQNKDRVLIQLVDVGVQDTVNWQLGDPDIDFHSVTVGGDATIRVPVVQSTNGIVNQNSTTVELWQENIDPRMPVISSGQLQLPESKIVAREVVELTGDGAVSVELTARNLQEGIHHFTIRMDKQDPLADDNKRYFSIASRRQQPTLIVADDPEIQQILKLIVDPRGGKSLKAADENVETSGRLESGADQIATMRYAQLPQAVLTRYAVIVLYDLPTLSKNLVDSLTEHVQGGGGLLIILGPSLESVLVGGTPANPVEHDQNSVAGGLRDSTVVSLLPGKQPRLSARKSSDRSVFWQPTAPTHPVYQSLEFPANEIAWQLMPIFKSWTFDSMNASAQLLATLSNSQEPLLTAQTLGSGQILTLMTPIPELERVNRPLWNELWIAEQFWWAYGILSGSIRTMSGADQTPLTFRSAEPVMLPNDTRQWPSRWELYTPSARRIALEAVQGTLNVGSQTQPGNYHLRGQLGVPVTRGFSVNIPAADTQLKMIEQVELDAILGENCYRIARGRDDVASSVGQARFGQELYPLLMLFVSGIFLAEQFMSNRFYKIPMKFGKGRKA